MKSAAVALALAFGLSTTAIAQMLKLTPSKQSIAGVTIASGATVNVNGQTVALTTAAAGLRSKRFIGWIHVYVGQLLVNDPSVLVKTDAGFLASSDKVKVGAITMTFVRDVDSGTVTKAYQDGLVANSVNLNDPAINQFLTMVSKAGDAERNKTITLLMTREPNGQEVLNYENSEGQVATVTGGPGFLHSLYSIWLGNAADSGVTNLKDQWMKWQPTP